MRRFGKLLGLFATLGVVAAVAIPTTAAAQTRCDTGDDSARWCVTQSADYPNVTGWYGWISQGSPCGPNPIANWFDSGVMGVCGGPTEFFTTPVWRYTNGAWTQSTLSNGTTVYVHPFTATWRWVYTTRSGWVAIPAKNLLLKWKA